jgi:hypothetical protein
MIGLAAGVMLIAQPLPADHSDLSPAEAALLIQNHLAYGMMGTYREGAAFEGRYIYLLENGITVFRRGVQPLTDNENDPAPGWYMNARHMHRFDLAPIDVELNEDRVTLTLSFSCLEPESECIGSSSSHEMFGGPGEDRSSSTWSIEFEVIEPDPAYETELEQLFEIWRTAPIPD